MKGTGDNHCPKCCAHMHFHKAWILVLKPCTPCGSGLCHPTLGSLSRSTAPASSKQQGIPDENEDRYWSCGYRQVLFHYSINTQILAPPSGASPLPEDSFLSTMACSWMLLYLHWCAWQSHCVPQPSWDLQILSSALFGNNTSPKMCEKANNSSKRGVLVINIKFSIAHKGNKDGELFAWNHGNLCQNQKLEPGWVLWPAWITHIAGDAFSH